MIKIKIWIAIFIFLGKHRTKLYFWIINLSLPLWVLEKFYTCRQRNYHFQCNNERRILSTKKYHGLHWKFYQRRKSSPLNDKPITSTRKTREKIAKQIKVKCWEPYWSIDVQTNLYSKKVPRCPLFSQENPTKCPTTYWFYNLKVINWGTVLWRMNGACS